MSPIGEHRHRNSEMIEDEPSSVPSAGEVDDDGHHNRDRSSSDFIFRFSSIDINIFYSKQTFIWSCTSTGC